MTGMPGTVEAQRLEQIWSTLEKLEAVEKIDILFAAESGSRAWGFASPDSDYDVRFIYRRRALTDYVRIDPGRDVIEQMLPDDLDIAGWDILKAGGLFRKSNPALLEWLHSPIIYREAGTFASRLRALAADHYALSVLAHHYGSMARSNAKTYIVDKTRVTLKKYLYAVRPLACGLYIRDHNQSPPTLFQEVLEGIALPAEVSAEVTGLLDAKRTGYELGEGPPNATLNAWIDVTTVQLRDWTESLEERQMPASIVNRVIWQEFGLSSSDTAV